MKNLTVFFSVLFLCGFVLMVEALAQGPSVELSIKTQKDFYRAGDEFRVNLRAWNPGIARMANLYLWVTGPDLKNYYLPDWAEMKHPWVYDLMIPGGFSFGPATIFETTLPDYHFPVWLPGQYQICAELVDASTGAPLGPFAMAQFGLKSGLVEMLYDKTNYVLDVAACRDEIWAASPGGVVRWRKVGGAWEYDRYTRFGGLSDTYMIEMYQDQFGNLIMWPYPGYGYGITVYDGHSFTNFFEDQTLGVEGVVTDRDMNMWVAAGDGIFRISRSGALRQYGEDDGLPASYTGVKIALDPDGYPVAVIDQGTVATEFMLCGYNGQSWWTIPFPFDWKDENGKELYKYIRCMVMDMRGHAWFGTIYGALEFDGSTTTRYTQENSGLASNNVYKMKLDSTGRLWFVCYDGGLCFYDGQNWGTMPGLDYPDVTGLGITFDGTLAIGRTEGLTIVEPGDLPTLHRTEGPEVGMPMSNVAWGPDGTMFMPDFAKGLWGYRDGVWNLMTSKDGLPVNSTVCIDFDSKGVGWIGSNAGVTRWEGDTFRTFTVDDGLATNAVTALAIDAFDHPWVIGGRYTRLGPDYKLSYYDGSSWSVHSPEQGTPGYLMKVACDTRGWVWVLEMQGRGFVLHSFDGQTWHHWGPEDGFFDVAMCHRWVFCDSQGNVYTSGYVKEGQEQKCRLAVFDGSTWTQYPIADYISDGVMDAAGRLWLAAIVGSSYDGLRVWDGPGDVAALNVQNGEVADNGLGLLACSPEGDIYGLNIAGLECHRLNPNVVAIANSKSFAPGDTLTLKYWAENPDGADRELDLYVLITLPTGDSVYLPTLWYDRIPYQTITIPKETTLNPTEILTLAIPADLPAGEYTITPWFCDHGSTEQTGQCTPVSIVIGD